MSVLPAYRPSTPFCGRLLGGFRPSHMIRIKGRVNGDGKCFIDFVDSPDFGTLQDIILRINIRPTENVIVRNHFQRQWGMEERFGACRVKRDENFEIIILAEMQQYKVSVNGHHLGVFRHRLPLQLVQFVQVSGDVTIDHVLLEQDMRSADEQVKSSNAIPEKPRQSPGYVPMQVHLHHHPPTNQPSFNPHNKPPPNNSWRNKY